MIRVGDKYEKTFFKPKWNGSPTWRTLAELVSTIQSQIKWSVIGDNIRIWLDPWIWGGGCIPTQHKLGRLFLPTTNSYTDSG